MVSAASPESTTYFNEATVRHIQATDAVGASRPEANARLRLVSRIATSVAQTRSRTTPLVVLPPLPPEPEVEEVTVAVPPPAIEEAPYRVLGPGESGATPPVEVAAPAGPSPPAPTPPAATPPPPVSN